MPIKGDRHSFAAVHLSQLERKEEALKNEEYYILLALEPCSTCNNVTGCRAIQDIQILLEQGYRKSEYHGNVLSIEVCTTTWQPLFLRLCLQKYRSGDQSTSSPPLKCSLSAAVPVLSELHPSRPFVWCCLG